MTDVPAGPELMCARQTEALAGQVCDPVTVQLAAAVEDRLGGKASLAGIELVRVENPAGDVIETSVHVFDLASQDKLRRAYAWPTSVDGDKAAGVRVVMHLPSIATPQEAVMRTLGGRKI